MKNCVSGAATLSLTDHCFTFTVVVVNRSYALDLQWVKQCWSES